MFVLTNYHSFIRCVWIATFTLLVTACSTQDEPSNVDWRYYKSDQASSSYSTLDQINVNNVAQLEVAWEFQTKDSIFNKIECNPLVIDGVLYLTTAQLDAVALDATTGTELWRFAPTASRRDGHNANRGLMYWEEGTEKRIYYAARNRIYALDANTGQAISGFGENGSIDLMKNLDREPIEKAVNSTTPGIIFEDLLIIGSSTPDGDFGSNPPGHIRAYNIHTGEREWIFHTIPHPGEFGYDTWPEDAWKTAGGANSWAGMAFDRERGIVYAPTGSPAVEHYGLDRHGANLFGNSVIALDARTGEYKWHFQAVHHDIWDYDLAAPPTLASFMYEGRQRDAVVQPTKMGFVFVLDRDTGEPIYPVEERPVPQSTLPGEQTWPTQPFPLKPPAISTQGFTEEDITDLSPEAHAYVKETYFDKWGPAVLFQPPSAKGEFYFPQFNGGTDWGGAAFDSTTSMLYVNASNEPEAMTMYEREPSPDQPYRWSYTGHNEIYDPEGFPVSKRPWGTLNAIDLTVGDIVWQVPLGTYPELEARGLPPTGTFNLGGPIVTAGGLVFIGATRDERFRAFDAVTGEVLWEFQLPFGGYATPSTYMVDGKQYVVIAAAGGGIPGTKRGDRYFAFALPD